MSSEYSYDAFDRKIYQLLGEDALALRDFEDDCEDDERWLQTAIAHKISSMVSLWRKPFIEKCSNRPDFDDTLLEVLHRVRQRDNTYVTERVVINIPIVLFRRDLDEINRILSERRASDRTEMFWSVTSLELIDRFRILKLRRKDDLFLSKWKMFLASDPCFGEVGSGRVGADAEEEQRWRYRIKYGEPSEAVDEWLRSMKDWNRQMHASNGNISFFRILGSIARIFVRTGTYTQSFELDDGAELEITASLSVREEVEVVDIVDEELQDIEHSRWSVLTTARARGVILDCPLCGQVPDLTRFCLAMPKIRYANSIVVLDGIRYTAEDLVMVLSPFLCEHYLYQSGQLALGCEEYCTPSGEIVSVLDLPGPFYDEFDHFIALNEPDFYSMPAALDGSFFDITALRPFTLPVFRGVATGSCRCQTFELDHGRDRLGHYQRGGSIYRGNLTLNGHRCGNCWPNNVHCWDTHLIDRVFDYDHPDSNYCGKILNRLLVVRKVVMAKGWREFAVCAVSAGYELPDVNFASPSNNLLLLTDEHKNRQAPFSSDFVEMAVPLIGDARSLALWRILVAGFMPAGVKVFSVNSRQSAGFVPSQLGFLKNVPLPQSNKGSSLSHLTASLCMLDSLGINRFAYPWRTVIERAADYGIDEVLFEDSCFMRVMVSAEPSLVEEVGTRSLSRGRCILALTRRLNKTTFVQTRRTRDSISQGLLLLSSRTTSALTAPLANLGKYITVGVRDFSAVQNEIESGQYGPVARDHVIVWVPFGTRGDFSPIRPVLMELVKVGFMVFEVPGNTSEEGLEMLRQAEQGLKTTSLRLYARVSAGISTIPYFVIAPHMFLKTDIAVTFEAPSRIARPTTVGLSFILSGLLSLITGARPRMRVGPWPDFDAVPRSTDGLTLDRFTPNTGGRPIRAIYAPGSSSERFEPNAVMIQAGNHYQQFLRADIAYVTGVGTACTAAAAGCRVVMLSSKLDRNFYQRTDAGRGMYFGADPRRILWHVIDARPRLLIPLWPRLTFMDILYGVYFLTCRHGFRILFYTAALISIMIRKFFTIVWGPGIIETLALNLVFRKPPIWTIVWSQSVVALIVWLFRSLELDIAALWATTLRATLWVLAQGNFYLLLAMGLPVLEAAIITAIWHILVAEVFSLLISILGSGVDGDSWLEFRFFMVGPFPVVHTRMTNKDRSLIAEGRFLGAVGAFVPYSFAVLPRDENEQDYWWFRVPTSLTWEEVASADIRTGQYSLWHNCQTQMIQLAGPSISKLGLGLLMLFPMILWMSASFCLISLGSICLAVVGVVINPFIYVFGSKAANSYYNLAYSHILRVLSVAASPILSWTERITIAAAVAQYSFSGLDLPNSLIERVIVILREFDGSGTITLQSTIDRTMVRLGSEGLSIPRPIVESLAPIAREANRQQGLVDRQIPLDNGRSGLEFFRGAHISDDGWNNLKVVAGSRGAISESYPELVSARDFYVFLANGNASDFGTRLGRLVGKGLNTFHYGNVSRNALRELCESSRVDLDRDERASLYLSWIFFELPTAQEPDFGPEHGVQSEIVQTGASVVHHLVTEGADFNDALVCASMELAAAQRVESTSGRDLQHAILLFQSYLKIRWDLIPRLDGLTDFFYQWRLLATRYQLPVWTPVEFFYLLFSKTVSDTAKLASYMLSPLLEFAKVSGLSEQVLDTCALIFAGLLDLVDHRHRLSPKPAWALLLGRPKVGLSKGDAMFASFVPTVYEPPADYAEWAGKVIAHMKGKSSAPVDELLTEPPTRGLFFPKHTYGIKSNEQYIEGFQVTIHETERELRRLAAAIRHGGSPSIDGAWLATKQSMDISFSRYTVSRPVVDSVGKAKIIEASDALFDKYPSLYDSPRGMTVANVIAATEWKYSAGLPFLPIVRKRITLKNSDWINAIRLGAEESLKSGVFPGIALHGFPKNQLVAITKLIDEGKPIRGVTAGDRFTAICYNTLAMEMNKRPPPSEALILPSFRRTEGGMQEVYKQLAIHPHYFVGDATQFDSTVSSELVVESKVRLWERGIAGNWGERATSSYMRSYYTALSDGLIVSLYDGTVVRKTGGGGTGSAATTPDNRDWVRVCLIAGWSLATGLPCSLFFDHVRLANASDDVAFSCSSETRQILEKWESIMRVDFGVSFSFLEVQRNTGILHLIIAENPDHAAYLQSGLQPSPVPVMHDPARLFSMRSEYRADRMRHNHLVAADVVATQAIGHAYLTAHNRIAYADIAMDWEDAVTDHCAFFFGGADFQRGHDEAGILVSTSVVPASGIGAGLQAMANRLHPTRQHEYIARKQREARRWLRAHALPSYLKVFELWVQPPAKETGTQRRYKKLKIPRVPMPILDVIRSGAAMMYNLSRLYPRSIKQIGGEPDLYRLTSKFSIGDFLVEKFIFWSAIDDLGRTPTAGEMSSRIRQSPFGSACDPWGFATALNDPIYREKVLSAPDNEKAGVWIKVWLVLAIYTISDWLLLRAFRLRFIGTILSLLFLYIRDMDFLYSFLSLWYWVVCGYASILVSNMAPRDPYLVLKLFSLSIVGSLPSVPLPGIIWQNRKVLVRPFDWIMVIQMAKSAGTALVQTNLSIGLSRPSNPMDGVAAGLTSLPLERARGALVSAGMGSGKSTLLPAAILATPGVKRVIITMPTVLLVEDYRNEWLSTDMVTKLFAGCVQEDIPLSGLVVMTSGLFSSLFTPDYSPMAVIRPSYLGPMDVVLVDEVSLSTPENATTIHHLMHAPECRWAGLTGTPSGPLVKWLRGHIFDIPRNPRFARERRELINESFDMNIDRVLASHPVQKDRLMISVLGVDEATKISRSLVVATGYPASVVSRQSPHAPTEGSLVCTTIADFGVSFNPPPVILIDCGMTIIQIPAYVAMKGADGLLHPSRPKMLCPMNGYHAVAVWTDSNNCDQRHARVGRSANGLVYAPKEAGTGKSYLPVWNPAFFLFLDERTTFEILRIGGVEPLTSPISQLSIDRLSIDQSYLENNDRVRHLANTPWKLIAFACVAFSEGGYNRAADVLYVSGGERNQTWVKAIRTLGHDDFSVPRGLNQTEAFLSILWDTGGDYLPGPLVVFNILLKKFEFVSMEE